MRTGYGYFFGLTEYIHNSVKNTWKGFDLLANIYSVYEKMQGIV